MHMSGPRKKNLYAGFKFKECVALKKYIKPKGESFSLRAKTIYFHLYICRVVRSSLPPLRFKQEPGAAAVAQRRRR